MRRPQEKLLPAETEGAAPSKTRRKAQMHALQDLGERLVRLSPSRLALLALPERLVEAIAQAQRITAHEARRRQLQFIGRLMRDVDAAPIEARLAEWANAPNAEKARLHAVEQWRSRLLSEIDALERVCAEVPAAYRTRLAALIERTHAERAHGQPPHAYRELFRVLNTLLAAPLQGKANP